MTNKSNADCKQGLCRYDSASRTKFFNGMLLTDEQLSLEQQYHRSALKRLNRYIWGSGIVCGFNVEQINGLCVKVHPGFALDCEGNGIESCECVMIDLSEVCREKYPQGCTPQNADPIKKCLMLRYHEIAADTVPVSPPDDDCGAGGKAQPQASRVREGFCLELSDKCPTTTCKDERGQVSAYLWDTVVYDAVLTRSTTDTNPDKSDECMRQTPECPDCNCACDDCGICLAILTIDCQKHDVKVEGLCRRYVWTPRHLQTLAKAAASRVSADPTFYRFKTQAAQWLRPTDPVIEKPVVEKSTRSRKSSVSSSKEE